MRADLPSCYSKAGFADQSCLLVLLCHISKLMHEGCTSTHEDVCYATKDERLQACYAAHSTATCCAAPQPYQSLAVLHRRAAMHHMPMVKAPRK